MKTIALSLIAKSLIVGVLLGTVTPALAYAPPADESRPQATDPTFTGWVRFSHGEFQLYADQDQVLQPFARPCVSGVLPRGPQRQAVLDLGGAKVQITGTTRAWSKDLPGNRIRYGDSVIRNDCGGDLVIEATSMRPI